MRYLLPALLLAFGLSAYADEPVGQVGPELKEVSSFKLDMKFVQNLSAATYEVKTYEDAHPDTTPKIEGDPRDDTDTLDRRVARISKMPDVLTILKKHGLTAYDYVVGSVALLQASGGAMMVQARGDDAWPELQARGINTDNVRFYMAHQDEIEKLAGYDPSFDVPSAATH